VFDQRIKSVLVILGCAATVMVVRSARLQIAGGAVSRQTLQQTRPEKVRILSPVRGKITDRHGTVLARHVACWDICIHYGVIADEAEYRDRLVRKEIRRRAITGRPTPEQQAEARRTVDAEIRRTWDELAKLDAAMSGSTSNRLDERRARVRQRVERMKWWHGLLTEREQELGEENAFHPVVRGLDRLAMSEATASVGGFAWVEIRSRARRAYEDAEPFAHVLGRLGRVGAKDIRPDADPNYGDELAAYRDGDLIGRSGAEALFEQRLRGRRGRIIERPDGEVSRLDPQSGHDVALSLDAGLQRAIYARLREAVEEINRNSPHQGRYQPCPGAAAVLLYMPPHRPGTPPRRDAIALVSYPAYDPATYGDDYRSLVRETWTLPLLSRAIAQPYPPGSTVKPAVLAAALTAGVTTPGRQIPCTGTFGTQNPRRCWIAFQHMPQHRDLPSLDAEMSLAQSCNTYYYTVGSALGTDALCAWYGKFGFGRGVHSGHVPSAGGSALNLAIGQGKVDATPLQVANLMATVATGEYVPVSLALGEDVNPRVGASTRLDVADEHWSVIRRGLWHVVNGERGTATDTARLDSEDYELYGKTGTAQSWARAVEYEFHYETADGHRRSVIATDEYTALQKVSSENASGLTPGGASRTYPRKPPPTHAWFVGYLQPRGGASNDTPHVALAVILEYAGSGSRQAAPVAKSIAELVLNRGRAYLTGQAPAHREGR
jgi:penicillin-binding protein 2